MSLIPFAPLTRLFPKARRFPTGFMVYPAASRHAVLTRDLPIARRFPTGFMVYPAASPHAVLRISAHCRNDKYEANYRRPLDDFHSLELGLV